ncbi:MAG: antitoxin Xre-like helix-turn-helix domain-containing protein [Sulfuricellaceae bacterium]
MSAAVTLAYTFPLPSAEDLLGGKCMLKPMPRSPLDWVFLIRHGLPSGAVDALSHKVRITQAELAGALGIPERTLARRKREGLLNSEESAKLVRLARAVERAEAVFEDFDIALDWLKSSNAALAGATPLSLLDTDIGAESVMDTLGRIEQGVFA